MQLTATGNEQRRSLERARELCSRHYLTPIRSSPDQSYTGFRSRPRRLQSASGALPNRKVAKPGKITKHGHLAGVVSRQFFCQRVFLHDQGPEPDIQCGPQIPKDESLLLLGAQVLI